MINEHLALSDKAIELLKSIETLSLVPYDDQTQKPIKTWCKGATIGYGHLISEHEWNFFRLGISQEYADNLFKRDALPVENAVIKYITAPLKQNQFDALAILVFNIGNWNFKISSVVKLVNDPSAVTIYPTLEKAWKSWNRSQGRVMKGLDNRRKCEWNIYTRGIYEKW